MSTKPDERTPPMRLLERIRRTPTGRLVLKIAVGVVGALLVALGIVLIPFPGPGWAVVILGLAVWALEFAWAKRLLEFTKRQVRSWTRWIARQTVPVRLAVGTAGLIAVAGIVWTSVRVSFGVDLAAVTWGWLT